MTNFDHDETVMRFARQLRGMGVDEALRARGAKDGDLVRIGEFEFEFVFVFVFVLALVVVSISVEV